MTGKKRQPHSEATKIKMSKAQKGKIFSEEHKANISKALIGNKNCVGRKILGRKVSEETRRKLSEAAKGKKRGKYKKTKID